MFLAEMVVVLVIVVGVVVVVGVDIENSTVQLKQ